MRVILTIACIFYALAGSAQRGIRLADFEKSKVDSFYFLLANYPGLLNGVTHFRGPGAIKKILGISCKDSVWISSDTLCHRSTDCSIQKNRIVTSGGQADTRHGNFRISGSNLCLDSINATTGAILGSQCIPLSSIATNWYFSDGTLPENRLALGDGFNATWRNMTVIRFDSIGTMVIRTKANSLAGDAVQEQYNGFGTWYSRILNPNGSNSSIGGRTAVIQIGLTAASLESKTLGGVANSNNIVSVDDYSAFIKMRKLETDNTLGYSDVIFGGSKRIRAGTIPIAYNFGVGTQSRDNTQGGLVYSAYRFPILMPPGDNQMLISKGDSLTWQDVSNIEAARRVTINAVGYSENLPTVAGINFETFFLVPSDMAGWKINGWEISLGQQAHAAGTLTFDLVKVAAGGSTGVGTNQNKQIVLAANNRYGVYGSAFSTTVAAGDLFQVRFVDNDSVTGSPRGITAKLNFVK